MMRRSAPLAIAAVAIAAVITACKADDTCGELVGQTRVVVDTAKYPAFNLTAGDSVFVSSSVNKVVDAFPSGIFSNGQAVCTMTFGDPLPQAVSFQSSNTNVAVVRPSGYVVGVGTGIATVTASATAAEPVALVVNVTAP